MQNRVDAVALYKSKKSDFPADTQVTTANRVDAVVYDSDDADDTGLLTGLGKTVQFDENASSGAANHSLQRQANGSFKTGTSSPNTANAVLSIATSEISELRIYPNPASQMLYFDGLTQTATARIYTLTGQRILTTPMRHSLNVSHLTTGIYMVSLTHKRTITTQKLIKK